MQFNTLSSTRTNTHLRDFFRRTQLTTMIHASKNRCHRRFNRQPFLIEASRTYQHYHKTHISEYFSTVYGTQRISRTFFPAPLGFFADYCRVCFGHVLFFSFLLLSSEEEAKQLPLCCVRVWIEPRRAERPSKRLCSFSLFCVHAARCASHSSRNSRAQSVPTTLSCERA